MDEVLISKLFIPQAQQGILSRQCLIDQLNDDADSKLTLVCAPAGFGKTTLVSQWLGTSNINSAWLSLEDGDDEFRNFASYLLTALQQINAEIGLASQKALETSRHPSVKSFTTAIINDLITLGDTMVLVLDDYHVITNELVHEAVDRLIEYAPASLRIILISRTDPPLRLSRYRACGQINEIRAKDLTLDQSEVEYLLNQMMNLELSQEDIVAIHERTEGWVTGLLLSSNALRGIPLDRRHASVCALTGSHRYIVDYLLEEVFLLQPPHIQDFMLKTSILRTLNASLCDAVTGQSNSKAILRLMDVGNVFIEALDHSRSTFRYYKLFTDLLQYRLRETDPELEANLHRRASEWHRQYGSETEAIRHAVIAGDFELAADQTQHMKRLVLFGDHDLTTVHLWLQSLPLDVFRTRPGLWSYRLWNLLWSGDRVSVQRQLAELEEMPNSSAEFLQPGQTEAIRALVHHYEGDFRHSIQYAHEALDTLQDDDHPIQLLCACIRAEGYHMQGDLPAAYKAYSELGWNGQQGKSPRALVLGLGNLANLALVQGDIQRAEKVLAVTERVIDGIPAFDPDLSQLEGIVLLGLGTLLYEQNKVDAASEYLRRGIAQCQEWPILASHVANATVTYARLLAYSQDRLSKARSVVDNSIQWMKHYGFTSWTLNKLAACQAQLNMTDSNYEMTRAKAWATSANLRPDDMPEYTREHEYIVFARLLMSQWQINDAIRLLSNLQDLAYEQGHIASVLRCVTLEALAWQSLRDMDNAFAAIEKAIELAEPMGYVRVFVDEGPAMASLLLKYGQNMSTTDLPFLDRLISTFPGTIQELRPDRTVQNYLVEPLTDREHEVLALLADGLSGPEIADELTVSLNTAKTHIKRIYGKLSVHSRYEAVTRAKEWELIQV